MSMYVSEFLVKCNVCFKERSVSVPPHKLLLCLEYILYIMYPSDLWLLFIVSESLGDFWQPHGKKKKVGLLIPSYNEP